MPNETKDTYITGDEATHNEIM